MAGKPRMSGARAALQYFGLPDDDELVEEYAERKQRMVVGLIEAGQFTAFPDALRLLLAVRAAGIRVAAASSSKNTGLDAEQGRGSTRSPRSTASNYDFIRTGPDACSISSTPTSPAGRSSRASPIPRSSSPRPASWASPPQACFVVEDAVSGITAAKAGGMAALGIARADDSQLLSDAGADLVVTTLDEVDREPLLDGRLMRVRSASLPASAHASGGRRRQAQTQTRSSSSRMRVAIVIERRCDPACLLSAVCAGHAAVDAAARRSRAVGWQIGRMLHPGRSLTVRSVDRVTGTSSSPSPLPNRVQRSDHHRLGDRRRELRPWRPGRLRQAPAPSKGTPIAVPRGLGPSAGNVLRSTI